MPKRSKFSLSHYKLFTANMGQLVPCSCFEVLPGDTIEQTTSVLVRATPLAAPVMHPVHIYVEHWYVPNRLVWNGAAPSGSNLAGDDSWESFITGGVDGNSAADDICPPVVATPSGGWTRSSLANYLGVPIGCTAFNLGFSDGQGMGGVLEGVSAIPFRAYNLIYNENYRDEDLTASAQIDYLGPHSTGAADLAADYPLQYRCWQKDYFTTSRPWAQKGPAVTIPVSGSAPVTGTLTGPTTSVRSQLVDSTADAFLPVTLQGALGPPYNLINSSVSPVATGDSVESQVTAGSLGFSTTGATADLAGVQITIDALRQALGIQRFQEARARWGGRYVEYLAYLGIRCSDARLQRPEFLGGGRQTLQWSEVLQTSNPGSPSGVDGPGALYGHGIGATRSNKYRRFFEEHGVVMTLFSVLPITIYAQGLNKMFSRLGQYDYFQKELQFVGQEVVKNSEVFIPSSGAFTDGTFGYQDQYDNYRRIESNVAGQFRSGQVFEYWHMARDFSSAPTLNSSFVVSNPTNRIFLDQTDDQLLVMASHSVRARRMVTAHATPKTF